MNLEGANEKVLEEVSETTEQETGFRVKLFFSSLFHLFFLMKCDYIECMLVTSGVMMTSTKRKKILQSLQPTTDFIRTVMGNWEGSRND